MFAFSLHINDIYIILSRLLFLFISLCTSLCYNFFFLRYILTNFSPHKDITARTCLFKNTFIYPWKVLPQLLWFPAFFSILPLKQKSFLFLWKCNKIFNISWINDCKKLPDKCPFSFLLRTCHSILSQSPWIKKKKELVSDYSRLNFQGMDFCNKKEKISLFHFLLKLCGLQLWIEFYETEIDVGREEKNQLYPVERDE